MSKNMKDEILDAASRPDLAMYRIRRFDGAKRVVVYARIEGRGIIPADERSDPDDVFKHLDKLEVWRRFDWRTLRAQEDSGKIKVDIDPYEPHFVQDDELLRGLPRHDYSDITVEHEYKTRTSRVTVGGKEQIMKVAPFPNYLPSLVQEIKAYRTLAERGTKLTPELTGFVYEEEPKRIIGFLCSPIEGGHPSTKHTQVCQEGLSRLHDAGVLHGDANKYNVLVTSGGVAKFIDLETASCMSASDRSSKEGAEKMRSEMQKLKQSIAEDGDIGRPFPE